MVKLLKISSGIPDNRLSITATEVTSPALLKDLTVYYDNGKLTGVLLFTVIPGALGTATVEVSLQNSFVPPLERIQPFNVTILGTPTPSAGPVGPSPSFVLMQNTSSIFRDRKSVV